MKKQKKIKVTKVRSTKLRTAGKVLLWTMLGLIFIKGAADIIMGNTISKQREAMEMYMETVSAEQKLRDGSMAFAEEFVREYLTFDGELGGDYENRIASYTAKNLRIDAPEEGVTIAVIAVNAMDVQLLDESHVNVTVMTEIQFGKRYSKFSLKVPVASSGGQYAVDEYPQIVPNLEVADVGIASGTLNGTEVSNHEKDQITSVIESFCKVYYGGSDGELMYYVSEGSGITNTVDGMEFGSIDSLRAVYIAETDSYVIDVRIKVANSGVHLSQHLYLTAEKDGDRFYVTKIDTRI
ncbi:MAG: conjugal transfer protein [Emergencia sp.]|nr:conjugal transfer protein [Emergencia sp.]